MHAFAKYTTAVLLVVVGVIHLLPVIGVLNASRLGDLYGVRVDDTNLAILMRHRAVLFGLLGLFLVYAAFRPSLQLLALIAGSVSVVSFLWLAYATGSYNEQISRVVMVDAVAAALLVIAAATHFYSRLSG